MTVLYFRLTAFLVFVWLVIAGPTCGCSRPLHAPKIEPEACTTLRCDDVPAADGFDTDLNCYRVPCATEAPKDIPSPTAEGRPATAEDDDPEACFALLCFTKDDSRFCQRVTCAEAAAVQARQSLDDLGLQRF